MIEDVLLPNNLAGVIVLYHPDRSTIANIESYIYSLSHLYVIDNSENSDHALVGDICELSDTISYHPFGTNNGIATALNRGCFLALQDGYHWLLTMDQDSHFDKDDFFKSIFNHTYTNTAIITASYNSVYLNMRPSEFPLFNEVAFVITSGNVLNLRIWELTGRFIDKLFIDEVDNEFCIRAVNHGFKILASKQVYLLHRLGDGFPAKHLFTGKKITLVKHSPVRVYYTIRNNLYLWRKFLFSNFDFVLNRVKNILYLVGKILLYFPNKKEYFRYIFMALRDSIKGKYGKFGN